MEDTLKRLLDAEVHAEKLVQEADAERERLIRQALADARAAEEQFDARIPELHAAFVSKAEGRAEQTVSELKRRYAERSRYLRSLAEEREAVAVEAVLDLIINPERD
ncbi:ATPase [Thioalbus denitrificans]|uniref:(H+)-ATPase G subunit n=1 Tax=Thioalbus denitrificans TaxID=547122 RepID=A0A369BY83_9GAMM|nr:ATPase [Thioalbus denitrificans]RCX26589.1 (H+)-ATPase G subunit [Thioalbus denitrificans]